MEIFSIMQTAYFICKKQRVIIKSILHSLTLKKMKLKKVSDFFTWCRRRDSNPHGFPHDFESCASAVSPLRQNRSGNIVYF